MEIWLYQTEEFFNKLTFEALDYNNDGFISEVDLFCTMKDIESQIFLEVFSKDFVKIIQFMKEKTSKNVSKI